MQTRAGTTSGLHWVCPSHVGHMLVTCCDMCTPPRSLPVYLNERFNISFNITVVNNGEEDGFAFTVKVMLPYQGITKLEEVIIKLNTVLEKLFILFTHPTVYMYKHNLVRDGPHFSAI